MPADKSPASRSSGERAERLTIEGDVTFGHGVSVVGDVTVGGRSAQRVDPGAVLSGDPDA